MTTATYYPKLSPVQKKAEAYVKLIYDCAAAGLPFHEPPPELARCRMQAKQLYDRTIQSLMEEIQTAKRVSIVKCKSCGAPLMRTTCNYCGALHHIER